MRESKLQFLGRMQRNPIDTFYYDDYSKLALIVRDITFGIMVGNYRTKEDIREAEEFIGHYIDMSFRERIVKSVGFTVCVCNKEEYIALEFELSESTSQRERELITWILRMTMTKGETANIYIKPRV